MTNILLLVICFAAGMVLRRTGRFPATTPAALNGFIIHVSLPALTLLHVQRLHLDASLVYTAAMAWLLFGGAWLFFRTTGKLLRLPSRTVGALILVCGLGNTSFVGLPMIESYYGQELMGIGVIADQLGSFMVLSTLGILTATVYSSGQVSARAIVRKILLFPPFQALAVALCLRSVEYHPIAVAILQKLGDTLTPLALASVGFQICFRELGGMLGRVCHGLSYKLLLGPALITLLFAGLLGARGEVIQVTIFEAAMAPMITAGIIAVDHELDPPLVTLLVGIGIPLSFLTLPLWWWLLRTL
jgi:hypothetical protein